VAVCLPLKRKSESFQGATDTPCKLSSVALLAYVASLGNHHRRSVAGIVDPYPLEAQCIMHEAKDYSLLLTL